MKRSAAIYIIAFLLALAFAQSAFAQARTTPVEVTNTPSVSVTGTPTVSVTGTPNVSVTNTPSVNVANSPSVTVGNSPTVKIDSTDNVVRTTTKHITVIPWSSNQTLDNNSYIETALIDTAGYKEIRAEFLASVTSANLSVEYDVECAPGRDKRIGTFSFGGGLPSISGQAGFDLVPDTCAFTVPVMADKARFQVMNTTGASVTVYDECYIYLVD